MPFFLIYYKRRRKYNMGYKQYSIKIPPDVLCDARQKFDEVVKILESHLVLLSPSEKRSFRKNNTGLIQFLELSHSLSVESPGLFPAFMDSETFREEYFATHELWMLENKINQFREYVNDTEILLGNRTLQIALGFYQTVKIAARHDIPGARVIFEELKSAGRELKKQKHDDEGQLELFD